MPHRTTAESGVRTFHARTGRLGVQAKEAMRTLLPRYGIPMIAGPWQLPFPPDLPVVLEVGSGMGETTAQMAAADPGTGVVAVEVHTAGVAALLRRVAALGLDNVRVVHGDAVTVLRHMVPPESLAGVRLFFPDPWPKPRHHKRRFVRPDLVGLTADRLQPGGRFHAATDWSEYAHEMLTVLSAEPLLRNDYPGFAPRPDWRPLTRFERRGLRHGHRVQDLIFSRRVE